MSERRNSLPGLLAIVAACLAGCGGGGNEATISPDTPSGGASATSTSGGAGSSSRGVAFVGFDCSPPLVEALADGVLHGIVVQNPVMMGEKGVEILVDHLEKKADIPKTVDTGEVLVTRENMDQPEMKALIEAPKVEPGADANASGKKAKKWRIMVIPKGTTHEHWKSVHAGAVRAAKRLGTVEIIFKGPQKESDRADQIALVDSAAATGVDALMLAPVDSEGLVPPVERAVAKGIPVLVFDSALNSDKIVSYVATNNYHGGELAAERLAKLLDGKGKIILLRYDVGSAATEEREKGFTDVIKKYPGITYLSDDQYAGGTPDSAQKVAQNLVARFRGQVDGIFTPNESSTSGMLRALREAGMLGTRP